MRVDQTDPERMTGQDIMEWTFQGQAEGEGYAQESIHETKVLSSLAQAQSI